MAIIKQARMALGLSGKPRQDPNSCRLSRTAAGQTDERTVSGVGAGQIEAHVVSAAGAGQIEAHVVSAAGAGNTEARAVSATSVKAYSMQPSATARHKG